MQSEGMCLTLSLTGADEWRLKPGPRDTGDNGWQGKGCTLGSTDANGRRWEHSSRKEEGNQKEFNSVVLS